MLTVHHLEHSRSQRILWLLEELGADYEIVSHARDPKTRLGPAELTKIHPLGKSPVIVNDGTTISESGAIIEYLLDEFDDGSLRPAHGTPEFLSYRYWLHYAEGTFATLMMLSLMVNRIENAPMPFFAKPIANKIAAQIRMGYLDANVSRNIQFMDASLATSEWFCGDSLTAADVQMSFAVEAALARMTSADSSPNLAAFKSVSKCVRLISALWKRAVHLILPILQEKPRYLMIAGASQNAATTGEIAVSNSGL